MYSKLKAAEMATSFGIEAYVAPGKEPRVVPRILAGEHLGTRFVPQQKRLKSYRQWLRFGALTSGRIVVDAGAERALRNDKSLLPAGIVEAEGSFQPGQVVDIYNQRNEQVGVGVIEIASDALEDMIAGRAAIERSQEAVHKDRLLLV